MRKLLFYFLIIFNLLSFKNYSQDNTVGLRYIDPSVTEGYTLFTPEKNNNVYLINNCGELINQWTFSELPGLSCYLLDNGTLLRVGKDSLELRDWDNNLIWYYPMTLNNISQHHDIEPLPNGNILCIAGDAYTKAEIIEKGRDPLITGNKFRLDRIVEIKPVGENDAEVVWEWKFIDHVIQDFDLTKENYGIVEDHPELLDLNFYNGQVTDWVHLNGIDYNEALDQIIVSSRSMSELFIIDHSTTTEEAAGHIGGNSGKGGDFLWRWGNPAAYRQGDINDQMLFSQHDSKWIKSGYPDEGKITVFNNFGSVDQTYSSVHIIATVIDNGDYTMSDNKFLPADFDWTWSGSIMGEIMFEPIKSGIDELPNGNFIICENSKGQISEITKDGTNLWTYRNPSGLSVFNQFDDPIDNKLFRAEKYPVDYPGFVGKDMSPKGIIEDVNSLSADCGNVLVENINQDHLIVQNPATDKQIRLNRNVNNMEISVYNLNGELVFMKNNFSGSTINTNLQTGFYIVKFKGKNIQEFHKIIIKD